DLLGVAPPCAGPDVQTGKVQAFPALNPPNVIAESRSHQFSRFAGPAEVRHCEMLSYTGIGPTPILSACGRPYADAAELQGQQSVRGDAFESGAFSKPLCFSAHRRP